MLLKTQKLRSSSSWYTDIDVHIDIDTDRGLFSFSDVNEFPRAAITNYHKLGGFNKGIYSPSVWETRCPKSRCWQDWSILEAARENLFPASLPTSGGFQQPLAFLGL